MIPSFFLILAFSLCTNLLIAQYEQIDKYFKINPSDIKLRNSEIQAYDVTLKWQNLDAINGNKINCNAVKATYIVISSKFIENGK